MKFTRLSSMEEYILSRDFVSLDELCSVFGKSKSTVRRDVSDLVSNGLIEKVYGGVKAVKHSRKLVSFSERIIKMPDEKLVIGKLAAEYVEDGDIIFIDSGTTTLNMIPFLANVGNITVLTNSMYVINRCMEYPNLKIISFGGLLNLETASFTADYCSLDHIKRFNIRKAFMAATGVSIENGATNASPGEMNIKNLITKISDTCFLLVDATKFDRSALLTYADLPDFRYVITDRKPPDTYISFFAEHNIICRF